MTPSETAGERIRVRAVRFLNTVPLVWGFQRGGLDHNFDISFSTPAECARAIATGQADIGLVPVVEMARMGLHAVSDVGIACHAAVRSILLVSKVPLARIRTLATDSSSRTSALLARVMLAEKYGVTPEAVSVPPVLDTMLERADAALLIGDTALQVTAAGTPHAVWDLGEAWCEWSGLPMVFALWAAPTAAPSRLFRDSWEMGRHAIAEIAEIESVARSLPAALVHEYLERNIVFDIGEREMQGMRRFLRLAARFDHQIRVEA